MTVDSTPKSRGFLEKFTVLNGAARELWLTFVMKFLIVAAYGVTSYTKVLWLTHDLGMNDQAALGLVSAWSLVITIATLLVGSLTDALGLRRTFFLGVSICIVTRAIMTFSTHKWFGLIFGFFPLAIGEALGSPVLVAATRKYSTTQQRSISFSVIYTIMNLGFLAANYILDGVRQHFGEYGHWTLPVIGWPMTTYRTLFLVSLGIELLALPVVWWMREGAEVTDEGVKFEAPKSAEEHGPMWRRAWQTTVESARETVAFFAQLVRQDGFYRLLSFLLLISFLKLVYMNMDNVFPIFGIRILGPGAPVGRLAAINQYVIIFLVPIVGALTQKISAYRMVVIGGVITAASVFIMTLPPMWFQSAAQGWVGELIGHRYLGLHGDVDPYYVMIAVFVIAMSFGEAFYSPRVYEYAAAIAPKGQEASYGSLSYVPFLIGKLFVGMFSGTLLFKYCPEQGEKHPGMMWLFIALTAAIAPIGLIALQRFIQVREAGRSDSAPTAAAQTKPRSTTSESAS